MIPLRDFRTIAGYRTEPYHRDMEHFSIPLLLIIVGLALRAIGRRRRAIDLPVWKSDPKLARLRRRLLWDQNVVEVDDGREPVSERARR